MARVAAGAGRAAGRFMSAAPRCGRESAAKVARCRRGSRSGPPVAEGRTVRRAFDSRPIVADRRARRVGWGGAAGVDEANAPGSTGCRRGRSADGPGWRVTGSASCWRPGCGRSTSASRRGGTSTRSGTRSGSSSARSEDRVAAVRGDGRPSSCTATCGRCGLGSRSVTASTRAGGVVTCEWWWSGRSPARSCSGSKRGTSFPDLPGICGGSRRYETNSSGTVSQRLPAAAGRQTRRRVPGQVEAGWVISQARDPQATGALERANGLAGGGSGTSTSAGSGGAAAGSRTSSGIAGANAAANTGAVTS
jgi:hypothetical protein